MNQKSHLVVVAGLAFSCGLMLNSRPVNSQAARSQPVVNVIEHPYPFEFKTFDNKADIWRFNLETGDACFILVNGNEDPKELGKDGLSCLDTPSAEQLQRFSMENTTPPKN